MAGQNIHAPAIETVSIQTPKGNDYQQFGLKNREKRMTFQGAVVKEQGVTFAIVIVKKSVIDNQAEANHVITNLQPYFPTLPIILMAQDHRGTPIYYGRKDIVKFLASVPLQAIPWKEFRTD